MQLALRADSDPGIWSAPTPPARRDKKLLMAGVALVGASAIAINPAAPAMPTAVQDRAVELSAWIDPIGVWGDTISSTFNNVVTRGSDLGMVTLPALWQIATSPVLYDEVASIVFNPVPGLTQFFTDLPGYAETIGSGLSGSAAGVTEHFNELPAVLESAWNNLLNGQFTMAFRDVVSWSVFGLGEAGWPLFPAFEIPGDIARGFGAEKIGEVLDAVFVGGGNAATGYAYSLLSPPITAMYQFTDILNVISGSLYEGDWETAISEVINAPAKVLNAFLNGYQPSVAAEWETFPGLFSEDGPIDAFFVKLPKAIAEIFAPAQDEEGAETGDTTADVTLTSASSTELPNGELIPVDVDSATETATDEQGTEGAAEEAATSEETTEETVPEQDQAPVDDEDTVDGTTDADGTTEGDATGEDATEDGAVDEDATDDEASDADVVDEDTTGDDAVQDADGEAGEDATDEAAGDESGSESDDSGSASGGSDSGSGSGSGSGSDD